jgi:inner membrane protein
LDNLTHTLTGLMLARAGVGRRVPRAGLLLMLAANAPDVDVVSWFGGSLAYLEYHRWFTHSLVAMPLMAALAAGIARLFTRGRPFPWLAALVAAMIGVASHLLLDWTNVYGVRLLLPFSASWFRLDITHIVDLWIWLILVGAVIAPALGRLVSSEIGAKPGTGRGWAIAALLLVGGYEFGRYLAHDRALDVLNARIYDGSVPSQVAAFPNFWNPVRWRGLVETSDAYRLFQMSLAENFDPARGTLLYKAQPNAAMIAASRTEVFQRFLSFSPFPLWRTAPLAEPEGATEVEVFDLRFGDPRQGSFVTTAIVDPSNHVDRSVFSFGRLPPR